MATKGVQVHNPAGRIERLNLARLIIQGERPDLDPIEVIKLARLYLEVHRFSTTRLKAKAARAKP